MPLPVDPEVILLLGPHYDLKTQLASIIARAHTVISHLVSISVNCDSTGTVRCAKAIARQTVTSKDV